MLNEVKSHLAGKNIFVYCVLILIMGLFVVSSLSFAQKYKSLNTFNKEIELQKYTEHGHRVEVISPDIYRLTFTTGESRTFYLNHNPILVDNNKPKDTTIINVWEIDTTKYSSKFSFWQSVDIANATESTVIVEDLNQNGLLELYDFSEFAYPSPYVGPVIIFEQDIDGIFQQIYSYDSNSVFVQGIGDVDSDGKKEIHIRTVDTLNGKFYRSDSLGTLPTTFDFIFYYYPLGQINDVTFGDFDSNGNTDCAFIDWPTIFIAEYDDIKKNFNTIAQFSVDDYSGGFAIGDFDQDSKTDLVFGTVLQQVYVIEATDKNQYSIVWQGLAPTYNAYMVTQTNDIDGNGKPEFWIGGQDFSTGISTFWCYEENGDNNYLPVGGIELRYLVTLYTDYLQSADMDNDGKEELIINLGNYLLILKFNGKPNQHSYEIWYAKINELSQPGANFSPVSIADLNQDGEKDILLPMDKYVNPNTEFISYLLIQDSVSLAVNNDNPVPDKYNLLQNFPNPFNSSTQIKVILKEQSFIKISIYNLLGKEVKTLLEKELPAGEYSVEWDGKNSDGNVLNSGVYFIRMLANTVLSDKANDFQKTIKSVLIK